MKNVPSITIPVSTYYDLMLSKYRYEVVIKAILDSTFPNAGIKDEYVFDTELDTESWDNIINFYKGEKFD